MKIIPLKPPEPATFADLEAGQLFRTFRKPAVYIKTGNHSPANALILTSSSVCRRDYLAPGVRVVQVHGYFQETAGPAGEG